MTKRKSRGIVKGWWRSMNCLVTGGGGFLGRYIVERLVARGDLVRVLGRGDYPELVRLGVDCQLGDLRDAQSVERACAGIETVFHVAAVAGIWGPWEHFYGVNTLGTRNVLAACRAHRVARLVYTSSPSVTFDGGHQSGVNETAPYPTQWLCHYPHSKALAEQEVLAESGRDGLLTCALRPHLVWGPRDPHLVPRLLDRAGRGRLRRVGDGTNRVDMIFVENAADAHLLAADRLVPGSPVAGRAYFLSQGGPVNCWDWINEILVTHGVAPVKRSISFDAAWRIGAGLEWSFRLLRIRSEPPMTRFLAAQLAKDHFFDIRRAQSDLNFTPQVSTAEGMRRLAAGQRGGN